jgi:hypothetical protein
MATAIAAAALGAKLISPDVTAKCVESSCEIASGF